MRIYIVTLAILLLILIRIPQSFATEIPIKEIERTEVTDGCKTIYYTDGSKEVFVTCYVNFNIESSAATTHVTFIQPIPVIDIGKILDQLRQILSHFFGTIGIGSALLAERIWHYVRRRRGGRPRDYHGIPWWIRIGTTVLFAKHI